MANPYFNATYYLATNPDLAAAGITTEEGAWNHYVEYGATEGRLPAPWFDGAYYLEQNPDLADAGLSGADLLVHFGAYGVLEGRQPSAQSAAEVTEEALAVYAAANPDLRAAFGIEGSEITEEQYAQLANHFYLYGYNEDRPGAPVTYETPDPVDPEEPSIPGETYTLTEGRDTVIGTENDDTVLGFVGQNQNGTLTNALSTGDYIDGGAGRDKIVATVMEDQEGDSGADAVINARTVNVEEVHLEALDLNGGRFLNDTVTVDAGRMDSVEEFWSDNSSADLEILDVRLGSKLSITKDITFGLRDTDYATNFGAYFDSQSLKAADDSTLNSQLLIRIADVSTETPATPLANVNLNLSFDLGTETVDLVGVRSTDGTYAGLVAALRTALEEAGYADVDVELSTPYEQVTFAGNTVTLPFVAQEILLKDPSGNEFSNVNFTQSAIEPVPGGFLVAGNAAPVEPDQVSNLIESNLVLDNAGRGSTAGIVEIGGMSNSLKGVEKFNVTVDRDSKIAGLFTTWNKLQQIEIDSQGANGSLVIGTTQGGLDEIDANAFAGKALSLGTSGSIQNLSNLDAGDTAANVTFFGANSGTHPVGFVANIQTGSGNDNITLYQDGTSFSGSTPTSAVINAGDGNNTITLSSNTFDGIDNKAVVTTGNGSDVITGGANSLTVNAGAGDDVIYAENTGLKTVAELEAGSAFAADSGLVVVGGAVVPLAELLYGRDVLVTLGLPGTHPAVAFTEGLEVVVPVESNGYLTTERDLYEAVKNGINNDPVLSQLAFASVDSNGHLTVRYLIDGDTTANDALVKIEIPADNAWADLSSAQQNSIVDALKVKYQDSSLTTAAVGTAYDNANAITDVATVPAGGSAGQVGIFEVDLTGLAAALASTESLVFDIDGTSVTLQVGGLEGFLGGADEAAIVTSLINDVITIVIDGVTYTFSAGTNPTDVTLTGGTPSDAFALTVTDDYSAVGDTTVIQPGLAPVVSAAGTDSLANGGTNVVTGGQGNDVIVLSSDDDTNDTVVFDAGQFGKDTIVHFTSGDLAGNLSADELDFRDWLSNEFSHSSSVESRARIETDLNTGASAINANDVTVVDFSALTFTGTVTFDGMTNAQVLAALNTTAGFTVDTAVTGFVGSVQNSLLMVHNVDNAGEYKVFQVTSGTDTGAGEFDTVTLVGSIDFGEAQTFHVDNFA